MCSSSCLSSSSSSAARIAEQSPTPAGQLRRRTAMAMHDDRSDLFIFDGLFEDKTIDDFFNFPVEDVEEDPTDQLLVMKDPSPAYLSWAAEGLIANYPPPPPPPSQQYKHEEHNNQESLMTVKTETPEDVFAADDITASAVQFAAEDASFPCEDDPELAWFSNFVSEESYSPTTIDIHSSSAATNYSGMSTQFRAGSTVINPVFKGYNEVHDEDHHNAFLYPSSRYRTPSPVSVLERNGTAGGAHGGLGAPLLIEVPNPKVVHSASSYSSSSSSSPTSSSSCSGNVLGSGLKIKRSPPESFAQVRGRAPRTKRSRPAARPEALVPIVAPPLPLPQPFLPSYFSAATPTVSEAEDDEFDHLLQPDCSLQAPIYIPVPKVSPTSSESTTTTATLAPTDSNITEDNDNTSSGADCAPKKKKKIKLTITSSAAAAAAMPIMHHPATDASGARKCIHCGIQKTPQWRAGPMGPKTLCNACGVRYKSGRLFPEYRPAASPTFVAAIHSNSHKKVVEMRNKTTTTVTKASVTAGAPVSSKGCELLNYIRGAAKGMPPPPPAAAPTATAGGNSSDRDW